MKCPFRTDANGEFLECYGKECMAYLEYEYPEYSTYNFGEQTAKITATARKAVMCRKMPGYQAPAPSYYVSCADYSTKK